MVKGGLLKDDADWLKLGVKEGQKLMMMGRSDEIVKAPEKGPVFMEDLQEEEQVVVAISPCQGLLRICEFIPNGIEHFVDREDKSPPKFAEFASLEFLMFPREDKVFGQSVRKIVISCCFDMKDQV